MRFDNIGKQFKDKEIGILRKMRGNLALVDEFRKLYNDLCPSCKAKVVSAGGRLPLEEHCPSCRAMVSEREEKIMRLYKGGEE